MRTAQAMIATGVLGPILLALCVGSGAPAVIDFDIPDAASFDGLRPERERGGPWTRSKATLAPGITAVGPAEIALFVDRPWRPGSASLVVTQGDEERALAVGKTEVVVRLAAAGPVVLGVATEARREFGVRLRALRVEPTGPGALLPGAGVVARMAIASMLIVLALVYAGMAPAMAAAASLGLWCLPLTLFGLTNSYVALRLVQTLWLVAPLFAFGIAALRRPLGGAGVLLAVSAALIRLMLLFHPNFYFGDIEIHRNVTRALRAEGRVQGWIHGDELQQRFDLGRASVSGSMRPLPYPLFFHTLASFGPEGEEVATIKALGVGAETVTIVLAFLMARKWFGSESAGVLAGLALNVMYGETLEFLRISFPAILGRTLDLAALLWLATRSDHDLASWRGRVALGLWFALCCLCYNASPVHWGLFIPLALLALILPPARVADARGLLAAAVLGGLLSLLYYGRYLLDVAFNVMAENKAETPPPDLRVLVIVLWLAYGPAFIAALLAAPLCLGEAWRRRESRLLLAWIVWVPMIIYVAESFQQPFGFFRKQFFVQPLFAILAARWAKDSPILSRVLLVIVVVWGLLQTTPMIPGIYMTHTGRIDD